MSAILGKSRFSRVALFLLIVIGSDSIRSLETMSLAYKLPIRCRKIRVYRVLIIWFNLKNGFYPRISNSSGNLK